jgi:formamidopyrimidine-DNA glycosylase
MPEGLEAEIYRRAVERCTGRTIVRVDVDDRQAAAAELRALLPGRRVVGARRVGKLVLVHLAPRLVLGLHFGMTGRLVVDDLAPIAELEYGSGRDDPAWDRLVIRFRGRPPRGGSVRVNDPRRWAVFSLDPDLGRYGPDVLSVGPDELAAACAGRRAAVKAVLLDQSAIAGFGNMCVDEVLWHAGIAPARQAASLSDEELLRLAEATAEHLPAMLARGGSHTGTISPEVRAAIPRCPLDGEPLRRDAVGGRTSVWCPRHQR